MSTLTLTVVHTIDPAALEILRALFAPKVQDSTTNVVPMPSAPAPAPVQSFPPAATQPAQPQPPQFTAPAPMPPVAPVAVPAQVPVAAPVPTQVPTAAATYTVEQLSQAAALFAEISDSNRDTVMRLLAQYGVQMLQQLKPEQFNAFAMSLREAGAKI